jgi:cellulose synthase/poly-beta-1,6-N-acetylglucosamine synthase-like glycosyltransferase
MDFLTKLFLMYAFISFYFLFLFLLVYFQNRKGFYSFPPMTKEYSLSIVIPCYNEEKNIGYAIENLLKSTYKGLKKVIAVDDCSTDNSFKILKALEKKYKQLLVVQTPKNTGCAAGSKNYGASFAKTDLIGFIDADSFPKENAIERMIGFFDNERIAAVTSFILVKNQENLLTRLQAIEYQIIAFTRRLLGFIEAIYVTPGPLAIYRKKYFDNLGGFDEKNLTEDIEITWHFVSKGYKVAMSPESRVYTVAPSKLNAWVKQRVRWNLGGIQTILKYKFSFLKSGMLGKFILPLFVSSWVLAISGLFVLGYRVFRTVIVRVLSTKYSIEAQTAILTLNDLQVSVNVLFLFGAITLFLGMVFTFIALIHSKEDFKKERIHEVLIYAFFYLLMYPIVMIKSISNYIRKKRAW